MPYLVLNDYKTYIQGDYLRQLVQGDQDKRIIEENLSIQAIAQRITSRYDLDAEFTGMEPYSVLRAYGAGERVTVDFETTTNSGFTAWAASTTYAIGRLVIHEGVGYRCTTANADVTFTSANWASVGAQNTIYYGAFPSTCTLSGQPHPATLMQPYAPVFNYKTLYTKGDVVFWKGNTYVATVSSTEISHQSALQYAQYTNIPYANVFPDDPVQNAHGEYWKDRTVYTIPANTPLSDSAWVRGDNRNQTIKDAMVRITVFKLSPLLAPRNRPDSWLDDYRSILRELKDAAEGKISMLLPQNQPQNSVRTWYCGAVKQNNII